MPMKLTFPFTPINAAHCTLTFFLTALPAGILVGTMVIADQVKPEARATVHALHKMGLRVCLLTGDNRRTAQAIADEVYS